MNFQQLEYIVAVDELKSFSQAAVYCHISQATLSTMIKKLEEELNIILFDRKIQPIITTDIGKEIIQKAKIILHEKEELYQLNSLHSKNIGGQLKLAIIPTIANALLSKILHPILQKYPELRLEIYELTTDNIIEQLKMGKVDIGILSTPLERQEIEEIVLYYEILLVYGEKNKRRKYIMVDELKDHKIWLLEEGNCLRNQTLNICSLKEKQTIYDHMKFEANSFETILNLIDSMGGLTLIPELYSNTLSEERKKKLSYFYERIPVREVSMVYYRPFAKQRIIQQLALDIQSWIQPDLRSSKHKKHELEIVKI